jgi:DNA-binding transcriptional MerR regulator
MVAAHHSIKTASRMTGLSAHHSDLGNATAPLRKRTATNRRLYSDAEIERLKPSPTGDCGGTQH